MRVACFNRSLSGQRKLEPTNLLNVPLEFEHSMGVNKSFLPICGEQYCNGAPIMTGLLESTINQVVGQRDDLERSCLHYPLAF